MKRTIKQWCADQGVNWLGQGAIGGIRYDWKLVLGEPEVTAFHGIPVRYLPSASNFVLSLDFPAHLSPFRNQKPPQNGDRLKSTRITMSFTVTKDTEPSTGE